MCLYIISGGTLSKHDAIMASHFSTLNLVSLLYAIKPYGSGFVMVIFYKCLHSVEGKINLILSLVYNIVLTYVHVLILCLLSNESITNYVGLMQP